MKNISEKWSQAFLSSMLSESKTHLTQNIGRRVGVAAAVFVVV